jgi:hypothetical protein
MIAAYKPNSASVKPTVRSVTGSRSAQSPQEAGSEPGGTSPPQTATSTANGTRARAAIPAAIALRSRASRLRIR